MKKIILMGLTLACIAFSGCGSGGGSKVEVEIDPAMNDMLNKAQDFGTAKPEAQQTTQAK